MGAVGWTMLIAFAIGLYVYVQVNAGSGGEKVCRSCGTRGGGKSQVKGSLGIEIVLWLCFIIPGLIYSLWRLGSKHKACATCGSKELIPVNSPMGQKIIAETSKPSQ